MKKSALLAIACALLAGKSAIAQDLQDVTYVEDPAQGYLINSMPDNWFITAEGGVNMLFTELDQRRNFTDRFAPIAGLTIGKWATPIWGFRLGFSYLQTKGVTYEPDAMGALINERLIENEFYKTKINYFGGLFDIMLNVTNWVCGYNPDRFYNFTVYAGGGLYWPYTKKFSEAADGSILDDGWKYYEDRTLTARFGFINDFRLTKRFSLGLDIRYTALDNHSDGMGKISSDLAVLANATYRIGKVGWNAPIVPICPPAENCDDYRARLQAADARISDLESQLRDCLNRPEPKAVVKEIKPALATIYYPCNIYTLTALDKKLLDAVAQVMLANPSKKYVVTGWADNYTGNDVINVNLRKNRAAGVEKYLLRKGVKASQLDVTINNGNLTDLGEKCLSLDRAVTIEEAK